MVATLTLRPEVLEAAAPQGFALATDVAEWLVRTACRSASAHEISGAMVAFCEQAGLELDQLDDDQLAGIDERLTPDVRSVLSVPGALAARKARGGTAPERVAEQLTALKALATAHADWALSSPVAARSERLARSAADGGRAARARPDEVAPDPARLLAWSPSAPEGTVALRLTEVEAYSGSGIDPARALAPRPDAACGDHVRSARAALRLLLLRRALVRERRRRSRGRRRGGAAARRRGRGGGGAGAGPPSGGPVGP